MKWLLGFRKHVAGKTVMIFLALSVLVFALRYLPDFNEHALALFIHDKGAWGVFLFVVMTAVGSALGFPRQALSFAGGYAFGAAYGFFWATLGTILGCAGSFFLMRRFGRLYLPERIVRRIEVLDNFLSQAPFSMTLTIRLMPFGNNALTNVLAGMSSIPAFGFIAGSCVGYVPQNFIFSLLGSGMRVDPFWRVLVSAVLFAVALTVGIFLFHRHRTLAAIAEKKH